MHRVHKQCQLSLAMIQLPHIQESKVAESTSELTDFSLIYGHEEAKRVLEIAAAGGHHLMLSGHLDVEKVC